MVDRQIDWLFSTVLGTDVGYRATGLRYSREDVFNLAGQFEQEVNCDEDQAKLAAAYVLANHVRSEMIRAGFKSNKGRPSASRELKQEIERLTKTKKPQVAALKVSNAADVYITQALSKRGDFQLMQKWRARATLITKLERIDLIRQCAPAANDALSNINRMSRGAGRPADHAHETFIAGIVEIFHVVLGIKPNANPRTRCRRLIATCAVYCRIDPEHMTNAGKRSKLAERAIDMHKDGSLPFQGVRIGKRNSRQ